ncbi:hypothetical protein XSR1_80073 [Xenorhabdus szentirmaii DSM 16338]|uniref:Uncharacterized protein n=1 Tax=Xenorhabdus szentirmaii DSM 16338 TaxID=1427518 RepID=W1J6A1_9GAMM|nr:hypothetical protein XSR1_80073 [Xenorhabdus szentirmaii DSM 16338]
MLSIGVMIGLIQPDGDFFRLAIKQLTQFGLNALTVSHYWDQ